MCSVRADLRGILEKTQNLIKQSHGNEQHWGNPAAPNFGDQGKANRSAKADRTYVMEIDAYIAFMYPGSTNKGWFYYSLMYLLL